MTRPTDAVVRDYLDHVETWPTLVQVEADLARGGAPTLPACRACGRPLREHSIAEAAEHLGRREVSGG